MRVPAVANRFYPGNPKVLREQIAMYVDMNADKERAIAIVVPHAGYVYSGGVAGKVYSKVIIPDDVIILGVNHTGLGKNPAIYLNGDWVLPFGNVSINRELSKLIINNNKSIFPDTEAHYLEHSLEVQVPFLQFINASVKIVAINMGYLGYDECEKIALAISKAIREYGKDVLIISSTDMSHFLPQDKTIELDRLAIDRILQLDPKGLYETVLKNKISMCGFINTTITLIAAMELGATQAKLVKYQTSGDVSGDYFRVVGYAGFILK